MRENLKDFEKWIENYKCKAEQKRYFAMQDGNFFLANQWNEVMTAEEKTLELIEHFRKEVRMQRNER